MSNQNINGALSKTNTNTIEVNTNVKNVLNLNKLNSLVGTVLALNSAASNIYGVNVKWFRSIPQKRSKDVLFLEWTLYNVEDCPLDINVIYNDSNYDDAALNFNMMGIEYSIPLTMSISIMDWQIVTNNDGSVPSKGDIIYIPQSNKLYEVVSMIPEKTIASQITSYKVNLQKYQPKSNRFLGDNLNNTIEAYTNSVDKLFGKEIKEEIKDAINDKQLSPYNSTFNKDMYKEITTKESLISKDLICDGHVISKSYYKNSNEYNKLVIYKNIYDKINKDDERTYTCIFNIGRDKKNNIKIDNIVKKTINYHTYKCILPYKEDCKVVLYNNLITIYGEYNYLKKELKISNNYIELYGGEDWFENDIFYCSNQHYNLLSSDNFSIDIIGSIILLKIKNKEYIFNNDIQFDENKWYNITIKIGKKSCLKIYEVGSKLKKIFEEEIVTKKWTEFINENYFINSSNINITNIRLYNCGIIEDEKCIINAISYLINDDSKLIISDNADIFFNNSYFGNQR